MYRKTQYNLYVLEKYVKTYQFLNSDEQFLKKNRKQGSFAKFVRKTAFSKILHRPQKAPYSTVLVRCVYGVGAVRVRCLYCVLGLK